MGIRMKHVNGYLSCVPSAPYSRWGCGNAISTEITDKRGNVIFPDLKKVPRNKYHQFIIPGYDGETSEFLTFVEFENPIHVEKGTELNIWYAEDLRDLWEIDNSGRHCVDVYTKIDYQY